MTARSAPACRPLPTQPTPTRRVASSHDCLRHLTPVGTQTDLDGCLWARYACTVDGTGYEILLGTWLESRVKPRGGMR